MKRKIILTALFLSLSAFITPNFASAIGCNNMEVIYVGDNGLWLKNVGNATCAGIAVGNSLMFKYEPTNKDRLIAIALTSLSLQKKVWVNVLGTTQGSIMSSIAVSK